MPRCRVDPSIQRVEIEDFQFPLGVYPVEDMQPRAGYTVAFEPADGDDSGEDSEWEEWPDRYVFDILISASRVESLCRSLFSLLPGRVFPILDVLGHDEYREVDPYVSYELLGLDRMLDAIRRYRGFFFEDGLIGFGAMSQEPFLYIFVDEHKIVTVRAQADMREKIEQILAAFDLEVVEAIAGADSATHEHRTVLDAPNDRTDLMTADEIVEELQDDWQLELNINPEANVDEEGKDLGMTGWRCLVRVDPPGPEPFEPGSEAEVEEGETAAGTQEALPGAKTKAESTPVPSAVPADQALKPSRYAEVLLTAETLGDAQELAIQAVIDISTAEPEVFTPKVGETEPFVAVLNADRLRPENFVQAITVSGKKPTPMDSSRVVHVAWLT